MSDEIEKISPYNRLQEIFNTNENNTLTKRGEYVIGEIIGKEPDTKKTLWEKFVSFFRSIDGKIFPKGPKITNIYHRRRQKK